MKKLQPYLSLSLSLTKVFISIRNFIEIINLNTNNNDIGETSLYSNFDLTIQNTSKAIQFKTLTELINHLKSSDEKQFSIKLVWNNDIKLNIKIFDKKLKNLHQIGNSFSNNNEYCQESTNIDDCLKLFSKSEKLDHQNEWYCPKCKKHQEATKQIFLWKLPKYLIIILKRFQAHKQDSSKYPEWVQSKYNYFLQNHVTYEKINTFIDFPLHNLDMSNYIYDPLKHSKNNNEYIYDLNSVINHLGDSLYSGHYTAFSRCHDANDTLLNNHSMFNFTF
jgi:hypothetical protein